MHNKSIIIHVEFGVCAKQTKEEAVSLLMLDTTEGGAPAAGLKHFDQVTLTIKDKVYQLMDHHSATNRHMCDSVI